MTAIEFVKTWAPPAVPAPSQTGNTKLMTT